MSEYKNEPKFAFTFQNELSHDDYNLVSVADDDYLQLITALRDEGHLNNTILVIMSDHGHRYDSVRAKCGRLFTDLCKEMKTGPL